MRQATAYNGFLCLSKKRIVFLVEILMTSVGSMDLISIMKSGFYDQQVINLAFVNMSGSYVNQRKEY